MSMRQSHGRGSAIVASVLGAALLGAASGLLGVCGPFTDVAADAFCPFVLEIFYLGITTGTTATTYDPASNVTRLQMAAFLSRTVDGVLKRGSRRAVLDQFWTPQNETVLSFTTIGGYPYLIKSDGADVWVAQSTGNSVTRIRASDSKVLETWTGANGAFGVLVAMGRVFVTGGSNLYEIDPSQPAGAVTTVASNLGSSAYGIAFDGARIWTANNGGSVSIVTPGPTIPWTVTTVAMGGGVPNGAVYDGSNIWITNQGVNPNPNLLLKLDSTGAILQTVTLQKGSFVFPAFDGTNIWVPNTNSFSVSVVRAATGNVLETLTGNGLVYPVAAAFDGQRVMVTNYVFYGVLSLFKAADLSPLGSFPTGGPSTPMGVCSDGLNFWVVLQGPGVIARF